MLPVTFLLLPLQGTEAQFEWGKGNVQEEESRQSSHLQVSQDAGVGPPLHQQPQEPLEAGMVHPPGPFAFLARLLSWVGPHVLLTEKPVPRSRLGAQEVGSSSRNLGISSVFRSFCKSPGPQHHPADAIQPVLWALQEWANLQGR